MSVANLLTRKKSGRVFDIKRYAIHDGPGVRISVHFKGCPLSCLWCHNPESQAFHPQLLFRSDRCIGCGKCIKACPNQAISMGNFGLETEAGSCAGIGRCVDVCPADARELCGRMMSVDDLMKEILKERIFFDESGGGVTLTGGEPLAQPEFAMAILAECRHHEIHTVLDTCGFVGSKILLDTVPLTDLYLYDVKHMDPEKHKEYTGVDNELILSNLEKLSESGADIVARMPFIPGLNSDDENIRATGAFLSKLKGVRRLDILPYHRLALDKHNRWKMEFRLQDVYAPTENALRSAANIARGFGIEVSIGG